MTFTDDLMQEIEDHKDTLNEMVAAMTSEEREAILRFEDARNEMICQYNYDVGYASGLLFAMKLKDKEDAQVKTTSIFASKLPSHDIYEASVIVTQSGRIVKNRTGGRVIVVADDYA